MLLLAEVIAFWNLKNTYSYIAHANFNLDSPKINPAVFEAEA